MCCGSPAVSVQTYKPASQRQARQDIVDQRAPIQDAVNVVYVGGRRGAFGMKGLTGRRYRVPGVNKPFTVDAADAVFFGKYNHGRDFIRTSTIQ